MTLTVLAAIATPGDYKPDAYVLQSANGTFYQFVPHNGISKLDVRTLEDAINQVEA